MVTLQLRQLDVPIGQRLLVKEISWQEFDNILEELGENRSSRIAYTAQTLEIRMPTPEHEVDKEIIGDRVKILLDELELDCECFGSTTFKQLETGSGIEPDQCFYIQHQAQMRGKRRVDLTIDPPPDLAIEVDVTSKTQLDAYLKLGVPELWIYTQDQLVIYRRQQGQYQRATSAIFPNLPMADLIQGGLEASRNLGRSPALRVFRKQVKAHLAP